MKTPPKDPDEIIKPAVQGTRRALNAALRSNVKRIVLTSSMVAACHGHEKTALPLIPKPTGPIRRARM